MSWISRDAVTSRRVALGLGTCVIVTAALSTSAHRPREFQLAAEALAADLSTGDFHRSRLVDRARAGTMQNVYLSNMFLVEGVSATVTAQSVGPVVEGAAEAPLVWTWSFPGRRETWRVPAVGHLRLEDGDVLADVGPETFKTRPHPEEFLQVATQEGLSGRVLDRSGIEIMGPHDVIVVGMNVSKENGSNQDAAARELAEIMRIDPEQYAQRVAHGDRGRFVVARTIRAEDAGSFRLDAAAELPTFRRIDRVERSVSRDDFTRGVLGSNGVTEAREEVLAGIPGYTVTSQPLRESFFDDAFTVFRLDPAPGGTVSLTIDAGIHELAAQALAPVAGRGSVTVLRPSTGEILASLGRYARQAWAAVSPEPFPPESTFLLVRELGAMRFGTGREDSSSQAGLALGFDQPYPPAVSAFLEDVTLRTTMRTPLSMAVCLASVVQGRAVTPTVLMDDPTAPLEPDEPLTEEETAALRALAAGQVTKGPLQAFRDMPGEPVLGIGDGEQWAIVAQGDLVVAVGFGPPFEDSPSVSDPSAGEIARQLLETVGSTP